MAAEIEDRRTVTWVTYFFLFEILAILILIPPVWLSSFTDIERGLNISQLGMESAIWIEETGHTWYQAAFVDSGAEDAVRNFFIPTDAERASSKGLEELGYSLWFPYIEARLDALEIALKRMFARWAMWVLWLPIVPLIVIPTVIDGMMCWRKRQYSFDYASPIVHGWAAKVLVGLVLMSFIVTLLPVPIPAYLMPTAFLLAGYALDRFTAHLQKRI